MISFTTLVRHTIKMAADRDRGLPAKEITWSSVPTRRPGRRPQDNILETPRQLSQVSGNGSLRYCAICAADPYFWEVGTGGGDAKEGVGGGGQVVGGDTRLKMRADMRRASILETHAGSGSRFGILSNVTVLVIGGPGSPHDGRAVAAVFHSRDARRSGHLHKCENPGKLSGKYAKRSRMCKVAFESLPLQEKVFFLYSESRLFIFCF